MTEQKLRLGTAFLSSEAEKRLKDRIEQTKPPGDAVAIYDAATFTLALVRVLRSDKSTMPQLLSWQIAGPLTENQAHEFMAKQDSQGSDEPKPISIN